ncbi:MAG: AMP-binding protein [Acidimicrobiaceae bacterium]|nr:AMP-binding protein [Acidimicrobiaceae bacterium]MBT5581291.1 AMP-binding protein [Acidimicrobiaceae bacterium]
MITPGNFVHQLHEAAASRNDAPFLLQPGGEIITYGDLYLRAAKMARVLQEAGVIPGDRVLMQVDKSIDSVALYVATLHAGGVHVPLNTAFTDGEFAYFIDDSEPAVIVVDPSRLGRFDPKGAAVLTLGGDDGGTVVGLAAATSPLPVVDRDEMDLGSILYTSGTTGRPKGAALSHRSLRLNARALHDAWAFQPTDHLVHCLPLFHVHGLFVALHCAMLAAIPVTFLTKFDAELVVSALPHATVFMGVPVHYTRLLANPTLTHESCVNMRLFTAGSAPLTETHFEEFAQRTGHVICERYGMSETMITTTNPYEGERRAGTVGFPINGVELRIADADGRALEPGDVGVIEVRGDQILREYWRRPDATAEARREDGWFITGDIGSLDDEGRVSLQGRAGDMIISGGENVYPKEIELVLDAVNGVIESAVIGVPHADFGEAVTAVIVDADTPATDDALDQALRSSLARFKHPKQIIHVEALPRNTMGKVQKNVLRDLYSADEG